MPRSHPLRRYRPRSSGPVLAGLAILLGLLLLPTASGLSLGAPPLHAQVPGGQDAPAGQTYPIRDLDAAPRPRATAVRVEGDIDVDARLDEPVWQQARVIDEFVQQKPDEGQPATERTEVRIIYTGRALYIGAVMYDEDPDGLAIPTLQRDPNTRDGDALGIVLDPFHDEASGFAWFVNPGGAIRDGQIADDGRNNNFAWEGIYTVRTRIHDDGWTLEMEIPWITLRYDPDQPRQTWGLNLLRRNRSKNEDATWAPMDRRWPLYVMSRAGDLVGLEGLRSRRPIRVKPYGLSSRSTGASLSSPKTEVDAGLDLKYGLTSGLTLDATFNTDFSQVEVDQQQVNLTRFSLFFPERREFFLENAGIFQFGDRTPPSRARSGATNRDFTLFFSRRIGLTPDGLPLPILGGGRLSGTAGPVEVGVLNMQTRSRSDAPAENFGVGRLRWRPVDGLDVGGIFVNRSVTSGLDPGATGVEHNRSYGVDAAYQTLEDRLLFQSYLAGTEGQFADGAEQEGGRAGRLSAEWRSATLEAMAMYRQFGDAFEPAVGFVRRRDIRHGYALLGLRRTVDWPVVQLLAPFVEVDYFATTDGVLETRRLATGVSADFWDGASASLELANRFERVFDPFAIRGAEIGTGAYEFTEVEGEYQLDRSLPVSATLRASGGGYFGGDRVSVGGTLLARWSYRLLASLSVDHNRIDLPSLPEALTADVYSLRLESYASPRLLGSALIQYNEATQELVSNVRFNWRHAPLSDVFLVLTERRDTDAGQVLERLLTLKVTRLFAF